MRRLATEVLRKSIRLAKTVDRASCLTASHAGLHQAVSSNPRAHLALRSKRLFSSEAATAATKKKSEKKDDSNFFLDNLGKIFLAVIATIIGTLVRSSFNTTNRNKIRDSIEEASALDPIEVYELWLANNELKPEVFRAIMRELRDRFPHGTCTYHEFINQVRTSMVKIKGGAFTIQLGHLLDRVITKVLEKYEKSADDPLPHELWLTALSLSLNSDAEERIQVLYEVLEFQDTPVSLSRVQETVGYLQDTCQLPPDAQVVATETKFPTQQWKVGTPQELVPWDGSENDPMDYEAFASILRSKSVCAWGECYHKKKF